MTTETLTGKKSHKGLIIGLILGAAALSAGGFFGWKKLHPPVVDMEPQPIVEQAVVTDVEKLFSTTGKVDSGSQMSMNSKATGNQANTGYIVDTVYVNVGTEVKKGDLLFTVDTTDLENEIELNEQKLALKQQENAIASAAAGRKLSEAQEASAQQYDDATRKLQDAADDTNMGLSDQVEAQANVAKYQRQVDQYSASYAQAKANYDELTLRNNDLNDQYNKINGQITELSAEIKELQFKIDYVDTTDEQKDKHNKELKEKESSFYAKSTEVAELQNQIFSLKQSLADAETEQKNLQTSLTNAETNLSSWEKQLKADALTTETKVRGLESEASSTQTNNRSTREAEAAAADGVATQNITNQSSLLEMQKDLEKAKQKLEGSSVLADMDGIVTAVNVMNGQLYTGTNAIVINNLETMKVTSDIDEAHIADIFVGQEVHITTESTGDGVLKGKVTYCSPTPVVTEGSSNDKATNQNANTSTSKKRAAYRVEVMLDEPNERLRIGMTAKMDFVIASAKNVIAVPSSAINSDGTNSFIRLIPAGSEETDASLAVETMVTTGVSNDYYTEITSGNVKEGDSVVEDMLDGQSDLLEGVFED